MSVEEWSTAWTAALDELELTLEQTQALVEGRAPTSEPRPWTPPQLASPLPSHLVERARSLLARQHQMIETTTAAVAGTRQTKAFVGRVVDSSTLQRRPAAVYLDVRA